MEKLNLSATERTGRGKEVCKRLRKQGLLPAIVYSGKKHENISVALSDREFRALLKKHEGHNLLITLNVEPENGKGQKKEYLALLHEIQKHPIKNEILHLDFMEVALDEKVTVAISVHFEGEVKGKNHLEVQLREIEIECLPTEIPEHVSIDISNLNEGEHVTVGDIKLPAGISFVGESDRILATVAGLAAEEAAAAPVEGAEAAAPAAAEAGE